VKIIHFRRNFGQIAALSAGFDHAHGNIIVTMEEICRTILRISPSFSKIWKTAMIWYAAGELIEITPKSQKNTLEDENSHLKLTPFSH
jgi:hypothetical protein